MRTLEISKDFTLEDIRKVRDYSYYRCLEIGDEAYEKEAREDYLKGMAILNRVKAKTKQKLNTGV
ncbi:MAG: hypothetical protein LBT22_07915 [Peptococcaceae bacterium]|jgi:hypothetical protein|nr:hypothetical protein [Peptococcaceae bacterium]